MADAMQTSAERAARTMRRLDQLAAIGAGGRPGANRPGLSAAEQEACELAAGWMAEAGLEPGWDACGNLYGRLPGADATAAEVWSGSHLDTVPNGGRFDGALGVLAAVEAIASLRDRGLRSTLRAVAFRDEEGWRFGEGCFGSLWVCGRIGARQLEAADADGVTVGEALAALGYAAPAGGAPLPGAYLEAHIEQGPQLERLGRSNAVVTSIAGMAGFVAEIEGSPGHAGTTPMAGRRDALMAAAELVLDLRERCAGVEGGVLTVGRLEVPDGASNVIPGRVALTIDARAPSGERLDALVAHVREAVERTSQRRCPIELHERWCDQPIPMSGRVAEAVRAAGRRSGIELAELASGGGHDAGVLAMAGVEAGMLFTRSANGSHNPDELAGEADVAATIELLAGALAELAGEL
jgi:allantoate deiminase